MYFMSSTLDDIRRFVPAMSPNKHSTNTINVALLEPLQSYEPMESTAVSLPLEETPEFLKVPTH